MNYTVNGKYYTANDGYIFKLKDEDCISAKVLRLSKPALIEKYEVILEPAPEEEVYKAEE